MKTARNGVQPGPSSPKWPGKTYAARSTRTEDQLARILKALRSGPQTTDDLREQGIYQTSARIHELRRRGHNIVTELFNGYGADGYAHSRMARYTLIPEKHPASARVCNGSRPRRAC